MSRAQTLNEELVHRELDLTVGQRLAIGFGLLLLTLMAFGVAVFVWHTESARVERTYLREIAPLARQAGRLERAVMYVGISLRSYLLSPEPQRLTNYRNHVEETRRQVAMLAGRVAIAEAGPDFRQIGETTMAYLEQADRMVELRADGALPLEEEAMAAALREKALATIYLLVQAQDEASDRALEQIASAQEKVRSGMLAAFGIGGALCCAIAWFTTQSVRRPTKALVRVAGALERGDWSPALHLASGRDDGRPGVSEMRRLSRAIGAAATALEQRERELREKNERIRTQNEALRRQNEVIQQQNEELQAQNQEIQSQAEELRAQSEELQLQAEELHSQNEELAQQGQELRSHAEALAEANQRTTHFLGVLAHELRNPLAPISNSIFILKRVPAGSEQAQRAHAVIERQTRHMIRLIDDLLDVTRISQGKIRVQSEPVDLAEIVRNCLEDQSSTIEQSGLELALDLPARPISVRGDHTRLSQVFGNLLSNAIKFTRAGGTVSVCLREDSATQQAVLEVADTGVGIDPGLIPQLFQPFSQGPNAYTHSSGGLGLGLALVKALVELHGGTVVVNSAGTNAGSRFIVRLPLLAQ